MPFTPFHMGPAVATKAVLGRHFSVPLYGFMQVAIDSEVLAGYPFRGDLAFHKILHTFAGATAVAALTLVLLLPALGRGMRWWNRSANAEPGGVWHTEPRPSPMAAVLSAFGGAWGHVLLDAPTHRHMEPMAPIARGNPFGGMVSQRQVMGWCIGLAVIGGAAILTRSYRNRRRGYSPTQKGKRESVRLARVQTKGGPC